MSRTIGQIDVNSDTFELWVTRTNDLLTSLATEIITANDATANTGTVAQPRKAQLHGRFGANTLVATDNLRGGNVGDSLFGGLLTISSNTTIGGNSSVGIAQNFISYANVLFENANTQVNAQIITVTGNSFIKGNTSVVAINVLGNTTVTNTIVNGTDIFIGTTNTSINSITIATGNTFIKANSTITLLEMKGNGTTANTIMNGNLVQITANLDVTGSRHTIAGNVIFDTTTMFVDSFNNRIGVGTITPDANLHVVGTANVSGAARLSNTLAVVGAVTLSNTLAATGAVTFANTLAVTGIVTSFANVNIDSGVLFVDAVTNRVGINNTAPGVDLRVTGATDISGAANVQGNANVGGTLGVVGVVTASANVNVDSGVLFVDAVNNRVGINNTAPGVALRVTGAVDISSTANVQGNANIAGTLGVNSTVTFANTIVCVGNVTLSNTLLVTGSVRYGNNENFYNDYTTTSYANSNLGTNISTAVNIFTFKKADYSSAKIVAQVKGTTGNTQTSEMVLAHNGTDSYITVYATVASPPTEDLGDFSTAISGTDVQLNFKQNYISSATKVIATLIK